MVYIQLQERLMKEFPICVADLFTPFQRSTSLRVSVILDNDREFYGYTNLDQDAYRKMYENKAVIAYISRYQRGEVDFESRVSEIKFY